MAKDPLPPSCHAIRLALEHRGPLTYKALKRETCLSDSTLSWALGKCESRGVIESQPHDHHPNEYDVSDS